MLGLPRPAQPGQLDPPKTGSLLSAAFYRTIKPKVQVRIPRPVIKTGRLSLPSSSCLSPQCVSTDRQAGRLLASISQSHKHPTSPTGISPGLGGRLGPLLGKNGKRGEGRGKEERGCDDGDKEETSLGHTGLERAVEDESRRA